jgi:hypothetical protein
MARSSYDEEYQPREIEFIDYLARLLRSSPEYKDVQLEPVLQRDSRFMADLAADHRTPRGFEHILIECKNASVLSGSRIAATRDQLKIYTKLAGDSKVVLAFPGRLSENDKKDLARLSTSIWDMDFIASNFQAQIQNTDDPYFQKLFLSALNKKLVSTAEDRLLRDLTACEAGRNNWAIYQKLVGRIMENLLCPPLESPKSEHSDLFGFNRRDFIFPNYAPDGFWLFMREKYIADYIIVDTKNYKGKVKKRDVLQIANYLKPHGAGLFGLIVCRTGADLACRHAAREQWMAHGKMIVILDDKDIEAMLLSKSSNGNPEKIIGQKIEEFRLSM